MSVKAAPVKRRPQYSAITCEERHISLIQATFGSKCSETT